MEASKIKQTGINRSHDNSLLQKSIFIVLHLFIVLTCIWLIYFEGREYIGTIFGKDWELVDPTRATVLLVFAFVYWLRHIITLFYLLVRKVGWSEVFGLLAFIAFFEIGLILLGGGVFRSEVISFGWLDFVALFLFAFGSYLNSFSEIQRKCWKRNPDNKGHFYTGGLFQYSMHINYFGDMVLFSGWCLFTHSIWTFGLPLLMTLMFIFHHIPSLDLYLLERYGEEFIIYSEKTKKLIPFIY
jgi:protein-S-isoprenylcysteine O-methyltransferase Ste14